MSEEVLFETSGRHTRGEIAETLRGAADDIDAGGVHLEGQSETLDVAIPADPRFEVELERLTDSETSDERYELEYEIRWTR